MEEQKDKAISLGVTIGFHLLLILALLFMEIRKNGIVEKEELIGIYTISGNEITVTDRYGEQRIQNIVFKDDMLIITDKDDPNKVIMRLIRIKEEG